MREFGFRVPICAKSDGTVVDGHLRLKAAKKLGLSEVPVVLADDMTEAQIKAFRLSVNKVAELAEWDNELLALEIDDLRELGFDLELTGFELGEIDALFPQDEMTGLTDDDAVPEVSAVSVTVEGDVWVMGRHRLMCGDSTSIDAVEKLMAGRKADMVFTDPPYGVSIVGSNGNVGGVKLAKVGVYAPVANDDSIDVAVSAIALIATLGAKVEIIWGGNYYAASLPNSSCWIVWDKKNSGNFADCELAWTNQKTAVRKFEHMWNGMVKASEHGQKRVHPTQKPIALAEWCIDNYAEDCETVLDLFGGSGSTLIACETRGKDCFMMELASPYCDVIIKRWQEFTGQTAMLEATGQTFAELQAEREAA
jgi:16S rRNA G966 N2-methylase RsmD